MQNLWKLFSTETMIGKSVYEKLSFCLFHLVTVVAYRKMGNIRMADINQAESDIACVRVILPA